MKRQPPVLGIDVRYRHQRIAGLFHALYFTVRENDDTFPKVIEYMKVNDIPLAGAVHDFICPQTGKNFMYFPIKKL